jgi:hypothetical protein
MKQQDIPASHEDIRQGVFGQLPSGGSTPCSLPSERNTKENNGESAILFEILQLLIHLGPVALIQLQTQNACREQCRLLAHPVS